MIGNNVSHNVGGILVSDGGFGISVGPAAHNLIAYNRSLDNAFDCGITLPGHDPRAVATSGPNVGQPQPNLAGVYDNRSSTMSRRVTAPPACSTLRPTRGPAHTTISLPDNSASGNGNAGFVLHSHAPLQDVSGIVVVGNRIGQNNLAGDPDTGVTTTTGVMLLSVAVPTSISGRGQQDLRQC